MDAQHEFKQPAGKDHNVQKLVFFWQLSMGQCVRVVQARESRPNLASDVMHKRWDAAGRVTLMIANLYLKVLKAPEKLAPIMPSEVVVTRWRHGTEELAVYGAGIRSQPDRIELSAAQSS